MDQFERRTLLGIAGIAGVGALAAAAKAGPLNPPAGSVNSTGRTTDEIYNKIPSGGAGDGRIALAGGTGPISINSPGSYVLTGPISGNGGNGITIAADHVTLDLNGHNIGSGFGTGFGIGISSGMKGLTIRNGLISGFQAGVSMQSTTNQVLLEDLFVKEARGNGIQVLGTNCRAIVMRRCVVMDTGITTAPGDGILGVNGILCAASGVVIEHCSVVRLFHNGTPTGTMRGISLNSGTNHIVRECCVTSDNTTLGATHTGMVFAGSGSIYRNNTVAGFTTKYNSGTDGGGNV